MALVLLDLGIHADPQAILDELLAGGYKAVSAARLYTSFGATTTYQVPCREVRIFPGPVRIKTAVRALRYCRALPPDRTGLSMLPMSLTQPM